MEKRGRENGLNRIFKCQKKTLSSSTDAEPQFSMDLKAKNCAVQRGQSAC